MGARSRCLLAALIGSVFLVVGCASDTPSPRTDAPGGVLVRYSLRFAEEDASGSGAVRFLAPDGQFRTENVTIPWMSDVLSFAADATVALDATVSSGPGSQIFCEVLSNQGPYGRQTAAGGDGSCTMRHGISELDRPR